MSRTKTNKPSASTPAPGHAAAAFASVKDEILSVPAHELLPINLDIPRAAGRGSLAAERIAPLLPALSLLPGLDFRRIERLGIYALALHHSHDLVTEVRTEAVALHALLAEATPLKEDMLRSAELLAHFGIVSSERVAAIRSGQGHADTADDLIALGRLFDEAWDRVEGKVLVTREQIDRAPVLGGQLHKALAAREVEPSPLVPPTDRRFVQAQAFTLFARIYDQARRGVSYLRWLEGDAHLLVPSLYPHRPRRTGTTAEDTSSDITSNVSPEDTTEPALTAVTTPMLTGELASASA
jgi:hypothetical protein